MQASMTHILKTVLFGSAWPYRLVRIGLGLVFVWAGALKLLEPRAFARTISEFGIVPDPFLPVVAIGLPALEFLAGLGLVFDIRGSLKFVCGLLVLFLAVLGFGIANNMDIDCGCFSAEEIRAQNSLRIAFIRDLGLMGTVSYLFFWRWFQTRVEGGDRGECGHRVRG